jgi:hypothetical protein
MAIRKPDADSTVQEAREYVGENLAGGVECPVCNQHAEMYRRQLTGPMLRTMAQLLVLQLRPATEPNVRYDHGAKWAYLPSVPQRSRDVATAAYWSLIQAHPERRGWWRVTIHGEMFLSGDHRIEKFAHVFNGSCRGFSGPMIGPADVESGFDLAAIKEAAAHG